MNKTLIKDTLNLILTLHKQGDVKDTEVPVDSVYLAPKTLAQVLQALEEIEKHPPGLVEVKTAIRDFENTAREYAHVGARDTEPDAVFQWLLMEALEGNDLPLNVNWQLYSGPSRDLQAATFCLTDKARAAFEIVSNARGSSEVAGYIKDYCWRC